MMSYGKIYIADALELDHPLNRGLASRWKALPGQQRGAKFRDLRKRNDGTLTNGPTWVGGSRQGGNGAIQFLTSGNTNKVQILASSLPTALDAAWTSSFWHRTTANVSLSQYFGFGSEIPGSSGAGSDLRYVLNFLGNYYWWGNGNDWDTGIAFHADSMWHHAVFVCAGGSSQPGITFYVDGRFGASLGSTTAPLMTAQSYITMGAAHPAAASSPNAMLDEGCIWNRALSASEVSHLYQEQLRGSPETLRWYKQKTYSIPAAAASFQAAWARNCNTYIGAGRA